MTWGGVFQPCPRHLANRVLPYVTELSKILESFDKLMIKILEDRNRSLRNAERYKFAVTLTPTQNAKSKQFPMPPKQRFTAIYDLLSELVDFSSMKSSLLGNSDNKDLQNVPDPMCADLTESELRMVERAENNDDLRMVKEAADYSALNNFGPAPKFGHFLGFRSEIFGQKIDFSKLLNKTSPKSEPERQI